MKRRKKKAKKYFKKGSLSLAIREMQIKKMHWDFILLWPGWQREQNSWQQMLEGVGGGKGHPHSLLLGLQLVQLSWKSAWRILKRQKETHHMTSYTAPWHVLKRLECWSTDTCSVVFIAAPFTKARRQKPRSPTADGCITEMVIHTLLNTIHL